MYRKNAWEAFTPSELKKAQAFCKAYTGFISDAKTERECADEAERIVKNAGFTNLDEIIQNNQKLRAGDRVYRKWMGKSFMAFVIGSRPVSDGLTILGAHIDSPRLDVKQNPLFEDEGILYLDTHYYGGIKKYQWLALPLALHGVIVRRDGSTVRIALGEKPEDPVFYITDLLPHLASEQMQKNASAFIDGEALNLVIGSAPKKGEEKEPVKAAVLALLKKEYDLEEEDFVSAELEIVPAGPARDGGLDRSMIIGYGHDDRVCAYPSLMAAVNFKGTPERTLCAVLTDKEEIGSVGATGMASRYFENTVAELVGLTEEYCELKVKRALQRSSMLSSDVSAAYDPAFAGVYEKKNSAIMGFGVCFNKYTGSRGKGGASDANAEFMAEVRRIMDENKVAYQTSEIGRVDAGGGGTIAYLCAKYGMNVIDCGVPVLSMHAPWEVVSKADVWEAYKCYAAFLKNA